MRPRILARPGMSLLLAGALSGCASFLPESGPSLGAVTRSASLAAPISIQPRDAAYALVRLDESTMPLLAQTERMPEFSLSGAPAPMAEGRIGIGDDVGITIFESGSGGLFIPADPGTHPGNFVTLPTQQVDRNGDVSVPFAGLIRVAGQAPAEVQRVIDTRLANRALEPQAIVTILNRRAAAVSVLGDVGGATRFSLDPGGEHLLGAIARAGGSRFPAYETIVALHRGGQVQRALLAEVAAHPDQDITLQAGDSIYLSHEPRYFLALGAIGQASSLGPINRRIPFEDTSLTLLDGLAKAGGLEDDRANAKAVFVYRFEPRSALEHEGVAVPANAGATVPTVYVADLADPAGFFYASRFPLRAEDVLFVSNSPSTDLGKFLALVLPAAYSASGFNAGFK